MKATKEQMLEYLNDTVKYYSEDVDRRCFDKETQACFYNPDSANKAGISQGCAIGRKMTFDESKLIDEECNLNFETSVDNVFELLPDNLKIFEITFLVEIQELHDNSNNWNDETGMTDFGKSEVKRIKEIFNME